MQDTLCQVQTCGRRCGRAVRSCIDGLVAVCERLPGSVAVGSVDTDAARNGVARRIRVDVGRQRRLPGVFEQRGLRYVNEGYPIDEDIHSAALPIQSLAHDDLDVRVPFRDQHGAVGNPARGPYKRSPASVADRFGDLKSRSGPRCKRFRATALQQPHPVPLRSRRRAGITLVSLTTSTSPGSSNEGRSATCRCSGTWHGPRSTSSRAASRGSMGTCATADDGSS